MSIVARCGNCRDFRNDPGTLERQFYGMTSMGSAYGSTRGGDGLCDRHDLYLPANASCPEFAPPDQAEARAGVA